MHKIAVIVAQARELVNLKPGHFASLISVSAAPAGNFRSHVTILPLSTDCAPSLVRPGSNVNPSSPVTGI